MIEKQQKVHDLLGMKNKFRQDMKVWESEYVASIAVRKNSMILEQIYQDGDRRYQPFLESRISSRSKNSQG